MNEEQLRRKPNKCSNCLGDQWELLEPPPPKEGEKGTFTLMYLSLSSSDDSVSVAVSIDLWMCQSCGHLVPMGRKSTPPTDSLIDIKLSDLAKAQEDGEEAAE